MPTPTLPTKTRMVTAMTTLIQEQGYNASGLNEILQASAAPKGSLYHHFPGGKTQLAAAAVDVARERLIRTLQSIKDKGHDPARAIQLFIDLYIRQMQASEYSQGCPVATLTLETAATVDSLQVSVKQFFDELAGFIEALLSEHGLDSQIAQTQAVVIIAMIEGALILSRAQRSTKPLVTTRDYITGQLQALFAAA